MAHFKPEDSLIARISSVPESIYREEKRIFGPFEDERFEKTISSIYTGITHQIKQYYQDTIEASCQISADNLTFIFDALSETAAQSKTMQNPMDVALFMGEKGLLCGFSDNIGFYSSRNKDSDLKSAFHDLSLIHIDRSAGVLYCLQDISKIRVYENNIIPFTNNCNADDLKGLLKRCYGSGYAYSKLTDPQISFLTDPYIMGNIRQKDKHGYIAITEISVPDRNIAPTLILKEIAESNKTMSHLDRHQRYSNMLGDSSAVLRNTLWKRPHEMPRARYRLNDGSQIIVQWDFRYMK